MMKTGLIITGGSIDIAFADSFVKKYVFDEVIAADRGVVACEELGITPDLIVGDFDSAGEEERERWKESDVPVRAFDPVKDWTDTEIAVKEAIDRGWDTITILGATGTRLDHVLGNIQTLALAEEKGVPCVIVDAHNRIRLHQKPFMIRKSQQWGKYVSLFAFGGDVTGLTLKGFYYGTDDLTMTCVGSLGVSNQIVEETATVDFKSGMLLAIESRD